jgi:hypothetical protein
VNYARLAGIGHDRLWFGDEGPVRRRRRFNWWTPADLKEFQRRGACVADQFEGYFIEPGIHHNGKLVLGEAIGDLAGGRIAWLGFQKSREGKPPQPALDGFTPEQQFWISWGQFRGDAIRPETQRKMVQSDPHPIAKFRVIGPLPPPRVPRHLPLRRGHGDGAPTPCAARSGSDRRRPGCVESGRVGRRSPGALAVSAAHETALGTTGAIPGAPARRRRLGGPGGPDPADLDGWPGAEAGGGHPRPSEAHFPRPSQVADPAAGTFGEAAAAPWDGLAEREGLSVDVELCRAVRDGEQLPSTASLACLREVAGGSADLALLLEAPTGSRPARSGLGTLDVPVGGSRERSWSMLPYAAKLAALRIRAELDAGQPAQALATCIDLLALARDTSCGAGLAGRLPAVAVTEVAFRPCVAAIDAAPPDARTSAAEPLRRIEAGTPELGAVLGEYALGVRARAFAPYVPGAESLPGRVPEWAREGGDHEAGPLFALRLGDTWHRIEGTLAEVVAAAGLPLEQRVARLDRLSEGEKPSLNPEARYALPQLGRAARTDARARAQVRLLRRALAAEIFRARQGRWPTAEELGVGLGPSLDAPLALEPHGDSLTLADPSVPRGELVATVYAGPF